MDNTPKAKRILYLTEREGGIHTKTFETPKASKKYIKRHHDSVVAYKEFAVAEDGTETFVKEGTFKPRTKAEIQKSKARLRASRRRRKRERAKASCPLRPTEW